MRRLLISIIVLVFSFIGTAQAKKNSVGIEMVKIPAGTFMMGDESCKTVKKKCPKDDPFTRIDEARGCKPSELKCDGHESEQPQHKVTITRPFLLSKTEVTQKQWYEVMGKNPSLLQSDRLGYRSENNPVENVSWLNAIAFVNALSKKEGLPACYNAKGKVIGGRTVYACKGYRLPTEAEWEYAARGGTTGARYGELDAVAWYEENSPPYYSMDGRERIDTATSPVGKKIPNAFGLHDMLGNVAEWCHDLHRRYSSRSATDPYGHPGNADRSHSADLRKRPCRGGSHTGSAWEVRAARYYTAPHTERNIWTGVRLARQYH